MFHSIKTVCKEIWENRIRMFRLAWYDLKNQHGGTFFGFLWNFLNPAFQVLVYYFVFAIGLRRGNDINGVPYIVWLVVGIVTWYYMNQAMLGADMSIINFADVLKRMRFPMSIVPAKTVAMNLITHVCSLVIVFIVFIITGTMVSSNIWLLPYFIFCATFFCLGYSLCAATINVLFRDFHNFMNTILRFLFFISPVMWEPSKDNKLMNFVMMINPFAYILNGYRDTLLYGFNLKESLVPGIIFWAVSIIMFVIGCALIEKFRYKFIDTL